MRITVYSTKGSAGKTPISANIALDKDYCVGTNELFHVYEGMFPDNKIIALKPEEAFPVELKEHDIDVVFDLAGSISQYSMSISSALQISDVVLIPIYDEYKSLVAGLNTVNQVMEYNDNIIVVATKLEKHKRDVFSDDWRESRAYKNIEKAVREKFGEKIPVMPLKFSKAFDNIFEDNLSIDQMMKRDKLSAIAYRGVAQQFEDIYKLIGF